MSRGGAGFDESLGRFVDELFLLERFGFRSGGGGEGGELPRGSLVDADREEEKLCACVVCVGGDVALTTAFFTPPNPPRG